MRTRFAIAALILATIATTIGAAAQVPASDDPLRHGHALLIGNAEYTYWPKLKDIPLQLAALKKGLVEGHQFDTVDLQTDLDIGQLQATINDFLHEYGNNSDARLFIYYAGHGYTEVVRQRNEIRGYITGIDTPAIDGTEHAYDAARLKAISMAELRTPLEQAMAKSILVIFDSCFAGTVFNVRGANETVRPLVPEVITDLLKKPARDIITAGSSDQTVPAHSPIPQLLLAALNGEADTYNNGVVSSNEIYSYLLSRVKRDPDIKLTPQYGRLPNPIFAQGQFLFRVAKYDLAPPQEGETTLRQDDREAARLYKLAADQGNASGQANLGVFYENGRGGLPKDDREAARLYKLAADQGDAAGQAGLGIFYSRGRGDVPMDDNEAARLFRLAADQGNANAQTNLGLFYDSARGGLHKDDREAARLYKLAADQGNASAQANLGFFYEEARGGLKQDNDEAERLYKRAADQRSAYTEITTIFELEGAWAATGSPGPKISRSGNALTVDMSAYSRQQASGSVIDPQTIIVTFSDEGTHAGRLWPSGFGTIAWSNRTFWNKLTGSAIPAK